MEILLVKNVLHEGRTRNILIGDGRFKVLDAPEKVADAQVLDATGTAILPALYNTHTHAAMTLLRGYADDMPLQTWLNDYIWPYEAKLTPSDIRRGSEIAVREMLASGSVFFNDMYFDVEETIDVVRKSGMRAAIGITVKPTPIAQAEFYNTMATGEKQAWIVNNSNPNPYEQLKFYDGEHFDYKALNGGPGWNGGADVTALYDKITAEPVMENARPYYQELRKIINAQVPSIPLFVYERRAFATNKLDGLILTEVGDINFSKCRFK